MQEDQTSFQLYDAFNNVRAATSPVVNVENLTNVKVYEDARDYHHMHRSVVRTAGP